MATIRIIRMAGLWALLWSIAIIAGIIAIILFFWKAILIIIAVIISLGIIGRITMNMNKAMVSDRKPKENKTNRNKNFTSDENQKEKQQKRNNKKEIIDLEDYKVK